MSAPRLLAPGPHEWVLTAQFPDADAWVAGHGRTVLTESESVLAVCARLLVELAGPDLSGVDANVRFTIKPMKGAR
ncbi:hypothetical protein OG594_46975 [Streptomyces sp. NBC_01214]|uniref:hypothetical protein n=1 Tax=Streptomyces sp. NBC_01214 TaxID=2903777 RepID=UPI002251D771|nr:hypothetical protein [Streptomyces sp. NBC_01214]MCX4809001.1 hypothetical protein [Streptomyces sp. NBC_01214]